MSVRRFVLRVAVVFCAFVLVMVVCSASVFAAGAPTVAREWVEAVGSTGATLRAQVNPNEVDTTYRFEYGPDTGYGTSVPVPDRDIGAGGEPVAVGQLLSGLLAGTTYHYRVVASNGEGTTNGADRVFATFASASTASDSCPNAQIRGAQSAAVLPDCRAWEMVSPVDKSGGDISASPSNTRAAVDGNRVEYLSLTGFGDAFGSATLGTEYLAERGSEGWASHALTPPQRPPALPNNSSDYVGDFSKDFSRGVFRALSPVTADENVANVRNLYFRNDLLSAGSGSYQLVSACPGCSVSGPLPAEPFKFFDGTPAFAGASEDFSHIIFESVNNLVAGATGTGPKLYEWVNDAVRLAGILPDTACGTPPCVAEESLAGAGATSTSSPLGSQGYETGASYTPHAISTDGSRIVFTAGSFVPTRTITNGGALLNGYGANLYLRENGASTVQLNVSERSTPDPNGPQTAFFMASTPDDSKILFGTSEALTNEDNDTAPSSDGSLMDLYMYDVNAPEHKHLKLLSVSETPVKLGPEKVDYVPGLSDDGSYVYFFARARLTAGLESQVAKDFLYVWHEGIVRYVAANGSKEGELGILAINWGQFGPLKGNESSEFRVTSDGRHTLFVTNDPVTAASVGYDNFNPSCSFRHCREVYLYNYDSDKLTCVSCDPSGERPAGDARFVSNSGDLSVLNVTTHLNHPITNDAERVFFDTPDGLVSQDTNGKRDVYEYDTGTGRLGLISSGRSGEDSFFVEATPSGDDVFFTTSERLVRAEIDGNFDLYDARVGGGIPAQNAVAPASCESDDCQGPAKGAPVFSLPSSSTFAGAGNTPPTGSSSMVTKRAKGLTRAQKLARALKACRRKPRRGRVVCEAHARKRYGVVKSSVRASRRAGR